MAIKIVGVYLFAGLVFLALVELTTHRITRKFNDVVTDNRIQSADIGVPVSTRTAGIMTAVNLWVQWPLLAVSLLVNKSKKGEGK
jgi:hypothetical protein